MSVFKRSRKAPAWKNIMLGITGGLAGSWLMNQSQTAMQKIGGGKNSASERSGGEPATVVTAEKLSESLTDKPLPEDHKKAADPIVHYAFGALLGGLYGGLVRKTPLITLGAGTLYGAAVWLLADEIAVPALGLAGPPQKYPASKHLQALGAHLVYGLTAEGVRRAGVRLMA
jgi:putative membrane protein